ncbi:MAG: RpiB/LacA/LacB family sugar-phosphate isomerase, partial [Thermovirgaceae bacterium]
MRIALGSDHAGFRLKKCIEGSLKESSLMTGGFGAEGSEKPWDYPDVAFEVGARVARREYDLGILVCGTGIGMSIAANKIPGVRAALAYDEETGRLARGH